MSNRKAEIRDGLRLAALSTMDWLLQRLGDAAPDGLKMVPEPSQYRDVQDDCLISLHLNIGFVVDIVSIPEQGIWSLQITEPDLGSDPGNPEQQRQAVPGRIIETNIGFRITGSQLECGFQTVISDPEGTPQQAEVYRPAIVRRLIDHPDFGLKQVDTLTYDVHKITTAEQLKAMCRIWRDAENQLPCVVFTPAIAGPQLNLPLFQPSAFQSPMLSQIPSEISVQKFSGGELSYDIADFAKYGVAFCRTYLLDTSLFDRFASSVSVPLTPGDIVVLEPACFGGNVRALPLKVNSARQAETMKRLRSDMYCYPRGKQISFGSIAFLSAARENLLRSTEQIMHQSEVASGQWSERLALLQMQWQAELKEKDKACEALSAQLERQKQYQNQIEQEKEALRCEQRIELEQFQSRLTDQNETIAYLRRKLSQPKEHSEIAAWVVQNFPGRLLLHPKAVTLLDEKSAREVSIELICDALDFLATDYWERRYLRISDEEMNSRCSEKYGRPFEVTPTGKITIEHTPAQYKVKYFPGVTGKPVESPLDYHLRIGNDPENLLRIYFLHDDEKQLIVVGSLPKHLKAVTIK
jgi:hypothetical protein